MENKNKVLFFFMYLCYTHYVYVNEMIVFLL